MYYITDLGFCLKTTILALMSGKSEQFSDD